MTSTMKTSSKLKMTSKMKTTTKIKMTSNVKTTSKMSTKSKPKRTSKMTIISKMKTISFWRLCPAWAYTALAVLVSKKFSDYPSLKTFRDYILNICKIKLKILQITRIIGSLWNVKFKLIKYLVKIRPGTYTHKAYTHAFAIPCAYTDL